MATQYEKKDYNLTMLMANGFVLISDNVGLAACISSAFAKKGEYFAVFDAPRMKRPDADNEIIRLVNAVKRLKPMVIVYGDLPTEVSDEISIYIKADVIHISSSDDLKELDGIKITKVPTAEYAAKLLYSTCSETNAKNKVVVVENAEDISSVIAANYAVAHNADFQVLSVEKSFKKDVVQKLNSISGTQHRDIRDIEIKGLTELITAKLPIFINWQKYERLLFITEGIPYSLALPELNIVHSSSLNLGHYLAHNIYESMWSKIQKEGVIGLFFKNRELLTTHEEDWWSEALKKARGFTKTITNIHTAVSELELEVLPYDALYIATHGSQVKGNRNTYTFMAADKQEHVVVLNESVGVGGKVFFIQSVDGINFEDDKWTIAQGKVWGELAKNLGADSKLKPEIGESVDLPMRELILGNNSDSGMHSPIGFDRLAYQQRPLVIVNACGSWSDISHRFMYAGATAYIGTLWPITGNEAESFAGEFLQLLFDHDLFDAFTIARGNLKQPLKINYVMSGSFESRLDPGAGYKINALDNIRNRLNSNILKVKAALAEGRKSLTTKQKEHHKRDMWWFEKTLEELDIAVNEVGNSK